ncbi:MarR family transcriptional regulator [Actinokineospora soli]
MTSDAVAEIVAQWRRQRPDLDPSPLLVLGRIARISAVTDPLLRPPFAAAGLGPGDFDALATLRRAGSPLTPTALAEAMLVTSGAVTKRLDRLESRGLVVRSTSAEDGRGREVTLTPEGLRLADSLIEVHLANERELLSALSAEETTTLAELLGKLMASLENR